MTESTPIRNPNVPIGSIDQNEGQYPYDDSIVATLMRVRDLIFPDGKLPIPEPEDKKLPTETRSSINLRDYKGRVGNTRLINPEHVQEQLFPNFIKIIDELDKEIQSSNSQEARSRLAAYLCFIGVLLQPYPDGNTQTFITTALWYAQKSKQEKTESLTQKQPDITTLINIGRDNILPSIKKALSLYIQEICQEDINTIRGHLQAYMGIESLTIEKILQEYEKTHLKKISKIPNYQRKFNAILHALQRRYPDIELPTEFILELILKPDAPVYYTKRSDVYMHILINQLLPHNRAHAEAETVPSLQFDKLRDYILSGTMPQDETLKKYMQHLDNIKKIVSRE